jgi:O-antigen/teichoic acid export membrane protein
MTSPSDFDNAKAVPYIQAMAVAIPFMGLSEVLGVITRGFGHAVYYVLIRSLVPPLVFLCALLMITIDSVDPRWIPAGFATAMMVAVGVGVAAVRKVGGVRLFRLRPEVRPRELYGYSFPVLLNTLMYLVVVCTPILLPGVMQGDKDVGIYRACMQLVISDYLPIGEGGGIGNFVLRNGLMVGLFAGLYWFVGLDAAARESVSKALRDFRLRATASS